MLTLQHCQQNHHYDLSNDQVADNESDTNSPRYSRKNTFSWSSTSSSNSTFISSITTVNEEAEEEAAEAAPTTSSYLTTLLREFSSLSTLKKQQRTSEILGTSASHGDLNTIQQMMMDSRLGPYLKLDASDDNGNGSTPLIYASCFGKLEIVRYLLNQGAKVDIQDKSAFCPSSCLHILHHN
jgi:hypothetical protein